MLCLAACLTRASAGAAITGQKRCASSVLGRQCRLCSTEDKDEDSVTPYDNRHEELGFAMLTPALVGGPASPFPCGATQESHGCVLIVAGRSSFYMAKLQIAQRSLWAGA